MAKNNMHISGAGVLAAGEYGEVHISGSTSIRGNVACDTLHISGSCHADGDLAVEQDVRVSGSFRSEGALRADSMHVSGSARVKGGLEARELHLSGGCAVGGDLQTEDGHISGSLRLDGMARGGKITAAGGLHVGKGVECEELRTSGSFSAEGLVNAGTIEMELGGDSSADEIGCETIVVRRRENPVAGLLRLFSVRRAYTLKANVIEATDISLEDTVCPIVRGQRVAIGPGCRIGRVEYSETLSVDPDAEVGEQIRTGEA